MILVIGGTGLVGSKVVELLLAQQQQVRTFSGGLSDWHREVTPHFRKIGVDVVDGDIRDQRAVASAVKGCNGIVHAAGIITPQPDQSLDSVNHQSVASLLPIAESAGVQRLIYVSCLGATQFSSSEYFRSKWQAENLIKQSNFLWTVFRPSLIFGPNSQLMRVLEFWVGRFPIVLCTGSGLNEQRPVSGDDVAHCIVQALYNRDTVNHSYDLVGPTAMNLSELLEMYNTQVSTRAKPMLKIPAKLGFMIAEMMGKLNPRSPVSLEWMRLLASDLNGDPALMQATFQVPMLPLESLWKRIPARK